MRTQYCITPVYPDCTHCKFGHIDTTNCETHDDVNNALWYCTCTLKDLCEYCSHNGAETMADVGACNLCDNGEYYKYNKGGYYNGRNG